MTEDDKSPFGFMYRKNSMNYQELTYWLSVPEFRDAILWMIDNNITIDNRSVYDVASRIYDAKQELWSAGQKDENFSYRLARRGLKRILTLSGV